MEALTLVERLHDAQNRHDLDAMIECFAPDYRSEQPCHPGRVFVGTEQVRRNWSAILDSFSDFTSELLRTCVAPDGGSVWGEWRWAGTRPDGSAFEMAGVIIFGVRNDRIAWGRLYMEGVDPADETIDDAVAATTGR